MRSGAITFFQALNVFHYISVMQLPELQTVWYFALCIHKLQQIKTTVGWFAAIKQRSQTGTALPASLPLLQWVRCYLLCKVIYKHFKAETTLLTFHSVGYEILPTVAMLSSWFLCSSTCLILHNVTFASSRIRDQTSSCLMARPLNPVSIRAQTLWHRLIFPPFQYSRHLLDKDSPAWWERSRRRKPWHSRRWWSTWQAPWCPTSTPTTSATPALPPELTSELGQPIKAWRFLHLHSPWFWLSSKEKKCRNLFN